MDRCTQNVTGNLHGVKVSGSPNAAPTFLHDLPATAWNHAPLAVAPIAVARAHKEQPQSFYVTRIINRYRGSELFRLVSARECQHQL